MMKAPRSLPLILLVVLLLTCCFSQCAWAGMFAQHTPQPGLLSDGKLHIFMLGTGDPEVEMQGVRKPACLALLYKGQFVLFDAGEGAIQTIAGYGLPYAKLNTAFITHWHSDHFAGLGQVINATWVHGRKEPFVIYGPWGAEKVVNGLNSAYEFDAIFRAATLPGILEPTLSAGVPREFQLKDDAATPVFESGDLKVSAFRVDHSPVVPAVGYVVDFRGHKLVISGDTKVVASLEKHSTGADLLISEAVSHPLMQLQIKNQQAQGNKRAAEFSADVNHYHADSLELAQMAQRTGVKHLVITHYVPAVGTTAQERSAFTSGMTDSYKGDLRAANDGDQIVIDIDTSGNLTFDYQDQEQPARKLIQY